MSDIDNIYSVKSLNAELKDLVEDRYMSVWVEGEIASLTTPASGHIYFSLKEGNSTIRCAFFKNRQYGLTCRPESGMQILVKGKISYYEARGDLQIIVSSLELAGEGVLKRELELLKKKLSQEGLFDERHKKTLPSRPQSIGIITAETGAALQDILSTIQKRYPISTVILYPSLVQGEEAPQQLITALKTVTSRHEVDVLIIARGGGSFEDLHAFNNEQLVREIFTCDIPVVTGIGHEIDFTLADFVADVRAPTPTGAAQIVTPDKKEISNTLYAQQQILIKAWEYFYQNKQQYIDYCQAKLTHPNERLNNNIQTQQYLTKRLLFSLKSNVATRQSKLNAVRYTFQQHSPQHRLAALTTKIERCCENLGHAMENKIFSVQQHVKKLDEKLLLVSPQNTLKRGYAIIQNKKNNVVIDANQTAVGEALDIHLSQGKIGVKVVKTQNNS